jgi:hypothetical protein
MTKIGYAAVKLIHIRKGHPRSSGRARQVKDAAVLLYLYPGTMDDVK